jgi:predicted transcriptional regulator
MKTGINDPFLTARIVRSYVGHHKLAADQLADLITTIHRTIGQLGQRREPEEIRTPAVPVRQSVRHDYVVCLDCGYQGKMLRRHISIRHGLKGDEYRRRWGLRSDHPLTAPAYSERRSSLAKQLGLGRKSTPAVAAAPATAESAVEANVEEHVETSPRPRRTRRSRSKSDVTQTAAEPTARQRRPRSRDATAPSEPSSTPTADV